MVSVPCKISLTLAPGPGWIIKAMAPSLMGKCTTYILSENDASVIITMNIYSHKALKIYLKLCKSVLFYYYCYRVHFSRRSILNFLPIFIMENDFLIHPLKSLKLSVILKTKCKRDPICINPSSWVSFNKVIFVFDGVVLRIRLHAFIQRIWTT